MLHPNNVVAIYLLFLFEDNCVGIKTGEMERICAWQVNDLITY